MKSEIGFRKRMIDVVKTSLETVGTIKFMDVNDILLVTIAYSTLTDSTVSPNDVKYIFKTSTGSGFIKGLVSVSGTVSKFEILGATTDKLYGTVGSSGSGADIEFNAIEWTAATTRITLENLAVLFPQGT